MNNIFLVGFMGTGKSAVGRILARRTKRRFVDMDSEIEQRAGKAISRIFAEDGEPVFRQMERSLAAELSALDNQVVATGGGIVLDPRNIADFDRSGVTVCLHASPEEILRRVSGSNHRPLLEQDDKLNRIVSILKDRRHLYAAIQKRVDTTALSPEQVADAVLALIT